MQSRLQKPDVSQEFGRLLFVERLDRATGIFDNTKLIVGSQGTLGLLTEAKLRLVPLKAFSPSRDIFKRTSRLPGPVQLALPSRALHSYCNHSLVNQ